MHQCSSNKRAGSVAPVAYNLFILMSHLQAQGVSVQVEFITMTCVEILVCNVRCHTSWGALSDVTLCIKGGRVGGHGLGTPFAWCCLKRCTCLQAIPCKGCTWTMCGYALRLKFQQLATSQQTVFLNLYPNSFPGGQLNIYLPYVDMYPFTPQGCVR